MTLASKLKPEKDTAADCSFLHLRQTEIKRLKKPATRKPSSSQTR